MAPIHRWKISNAQNDHGSLSDTVTGNPGLFSSYRFRGIDHVGRLTFKNMINGNYTDWKIGVTKDFNGAVFDKTKDAGRSTLVLSVSKTF